MRVTSKGQITIPADLRQQAGLLPNTQVELRLDGNAVRIVPLPMPKPGGRGAAIVASGTRH